MSQGKQFWNYMSALYPSKESDFQCVYPLLLINGFRMDFRILAIDFKLQAVGGKNEMTVIP